MKVLVFLESDEGRIKKSSLEATSYAAEIARETVAMVFGELDLSELNKVGSAGAKKILHVTDSNFDQSNIMAVSTAIAQVFEIENFELMVMAKSSLADSVSARVSIKVDASVASNVTNLPDMANGFTVIRSIYTGKAFARTKLTSKKKILTIRKNTVPILENGSDPEVELFQPNLKSSDTAVKVLSQEKSSGDILLPEADIVVSGGRGLKGPENWGMVEDLAGALSAATGCSKPVSDMDWRPHHEHVGQTGVKVSPVLYVAVGISGAIQHLAGVNSSKFILVINKDPEAPFFKAADYGIVGDAFDVLPKLTKAINAAQG
ncbi:MAG: electron transfer flavoprotein subunit alpha [Flammeovirgaceae bacterium]|nr:electron transfer flavoprotein subunit alpha [Flammeovirgaceae bacterium]